MKISTCRICGRPLAECKTAWACGPLFCSSQCGVDWAKTKYAEDEYTSEDDLTQKATAYFNDIAEEIDVETLGITETIKTVYSEADGITIIFRIVWEDNEELFMEVIGFYFGEPSDYLTEEYAGNLKATFYKCEDI